LLRGLRQCWVIDARAGGHAWIVVRLTP
jgi:hypothetical protein